MWPAIARVKAYCILVLAVAVLGRKASYDRHNPDHFRVLALCCSLCFEIFEKNPKRVLTLRRLYR